MSVRPTVWQWRWMMKDVLFDVTSNFGSSSADGMRHATISRSRSFNPSVLGHTLPSYRAHALSFNKVTVERRALLECVTQQPRTLIYAKFAPFLADFFVSVSRPRPLPDAASDLPPSNPIWASEWTATATAPSFSLSPS